MSENQFQIGMIVQVQPFEDAKETLPKEYAVFKANGWRGRIYAHEVWAHSQNCWGVESGGETVWFSNEGLTPITPAFAEGQRVRIQPLNPDRDELMDVIGAVGEIVDYAPDRAQAHNAHVYGVALHGGRRLYFRAEELRPFSSPRNEDEMSLNELNAWCAGYPENFV